MANNQRKDDGTALNRRPPPPARPAGASTGGDNPEPEKRKCFVIAPIGREGSDVRKRSDQILRHIIDPVVTGLGYDRPVRADRISESGRITRQVIQHILEDDLVIADLTDSNPNVYYELALRHAVRKPFVQILTGDEPLPFDVADQRTIMIDHKDLDSVANARDELKRQVESLISDPSQMDTPLSFALDIATLKGSEDPGDRTQAEMLEMLQELRMMQSLTYGAVRKPTSKDDLAALRRFVEDVTKDGSVTDEDVERLVNAETSQEHDRWVNSVKRQMNPFMRAKRVTVVAPSDVSANSSPWSTPAAPGFGDEPPF